MSTYYDEKFVIKVNEIFHDVEAEVYSERHPEILVDEVERWEEIAKKYLIRDSPITIFDVGTGTGFVPLVIAPFLKKEDSIICSDVSSAMLEICKKELERRHFKCGFRFIKSKGDLNSMKDESIDIITMNSILHHIPNVDEFCVQISSILSKGSILIIAHEPNELFFTNRFLWNNYILLNKIVNLLPFIKASDRKSTQSDVIFNKVNMRLMNEGLIEEPLQKNEIVSIVDIHSPTAGGILNKERGFNLNQLLHDNLTNFDLIHFETYNHCCKVTNRTLFTKTYDNLLRKIFPEKGAQFFVTLKKK